MQRRIDRSRTDSHDPCIRTRGAGGVACGHTPAARGLTGCLAGPGLQHAARGQLRPWKWGLDPLVRRGAPVPLVAHSSPARPRRGCRERRRAAALRRRWKPPLCLRARPRAMPASGCSISPSRGRTARQSRFRRCPDRCAVRSRMSCAIFQTAPAGSVKAAVRLSQDRSTGPLSRTMSRSCNSRQTTSTSSTHRPSNIRGVAPTTAGRAGATTSAAAVTVSTFSIVPPSSKTVDTSSSNTARSPSTSR